jgi:hypothetical protein
VVPGQAALAAVRLDHGHAVGVNKGAQRGPGLAVQHTAAGDDERALRTAQQGDGVGQFALVRRRTAETQHAGAQEILGAVEGHGLHVLRQREAGRTAVGRVGHRLNRARQRGEDVLGSREAVEVARDRAEAVAGADIALAEAFDLLQHRVGPAGGEHVTGQQQHRDAVDVGNGRRRDHVGRARADAGGHGHDALAELGFGERDGRVRHGLFVVGAVGGELVALGHQGLAQAGHVAVAEDGEHTAAIGFDRGVAVEVFHLHPQGGQVFHQRLRHR